MQKKLREDYNKNLRNVLPVSNYIRYIERTLDHIYSHGILSIEDAELIAQDSIRNILLIDKNMGSSKPANQLYTIKEAYEHLLDVDTAYYDKRILQLCNLNNYLTPNLIYDKEKSESARQDLLSNISWANGYVLNGQKIIDRGEIVNEQTYNILLSLQKEWEKRSESTKEIRLTIMGQTLFVGIFVLFFMIYLELFRKKYYERKGTLTLLFALIVFFPVVLSIMVAQNISNVYVIPFAMIPIIVGVFLDSRTAFVAHVIIILLCSISLRYPHEFIILQAATGMTAIYSLRELSQRSQLLRTAILVFLCYTLLYFAFELIHEDDLTKLNEAGLNLARKVVRAESGVYPGKDLRLYLQCNVGRALQHQQQFIARDVRDCSRNLPALTPDGQSCRRSSQQDRSQQSVGPYRSIVSRHRQDGQGLHGRKLSGRRLPKTRRHRLRPVDHRSLHGLGKDRKIHLHRRRQTVNIR